MNFVFEGRALVQTVTRGPLTAEARIRSQDSPCMIVNDKVVMGQGVLPVPRSSPHSIIPKLLHMKLLMALLQEEHADEAKEPLNNSMFFRISEGGGQKSIFTFLCSKLLK
jgi:hypothetical protein